MSVNAVKPYPGDESLGPLEIKTRVTKPRCIRSIAVYSSLFVVYALLVLLNARHDHKIGVEQFFFFLVWISQIAPWIQYLQRIKREGPIEITTRNRYITPEQRRFENRLILLMLAVTSGMAAAMIGVFFLLGHHPINPLLFTVIVTLFMCLGMIPFGLYTLNTRKRLAEDAERRVAEATQNISPASSRTVETQLTGENTPGNKRWWTQSALRQDGQNTNDETRQRLQGNSG